MNWKNDLKKQIDAKEIIEDNCTPKIFSGNISNIIGEITATADGSIILSTNNCMYMLVDGDWYQLQGEYELEG